MYQPTAADHTRIAAARKEEALNLFRKRWETITNSKPRVGIWTSIRMDYDRGDTRLKYMHSVCTLARAHATMAHRLTTAGLRLIPLKDLP